MSVNDAIAQENKARKAGCEIEYFAPVFLVSDLPALVHTRPPVEHWRLLPALWTVDSADLCGGHVARNRAGIPERNVGT